jgi:hypothetical protein
MSFTPKHPSGLQRALGTCAPPRSTRSLTACIKSTTLRSTLSGCLAVSVPTTQILPVKSTSITINWDILKTWIEACANDHGPSCISESVVKLEELKVIDCATKTDVSAPENCRFVALSYVWGHGRNPPHEDASRLCDLPRTVEDSLVVTRSLGYRYL